MDSIPRRQALKTLGVAGAGALIGVGQVDAAETPIVVTGTPVLVVIEPVSRQTVRISLIPAGSAGAGANAATSIPLDGSLVKPSWSKPAARITTLSATEERVRSGDLTVIVSMSSVGGHALTIRVEAADGRVVQQLRVDADTGGVTFPLGDAPVLGFGQGGPQFDRRGVVDRMRSGAGGYRLRTHGGRVPVPWLIGTSGWAMFIHQPFGTFDLSGPDGRFTPAIPGAPATAPEPGASGTPGTPAAPSAAPSAALPPSVTPPALPLDIFIVASREPAGVMAEWARLTGLPELPPLWALGYQQSHRTLASRDEVVGIAKTFREKKLPCDALIYLGTGFTNSGWNTANGTQSFNRRIFTDPKAVIDGMGLPVMRALWLHHPDDSTAIARGDQYLWGRDILVAPVTEKGATSRKVYLPRGKWYDFWNNETIEGGREIDRKVDLATMPLYVRAGAIVPMGPVKQYTDEPVAGPLTVTIYPGADGAFLMYEDDGKSFAHRNGAWTGIELTWHDASRRLTIRLSKGSRLLPPARRPMEIRLANAAPGTTPREITFEGRELIVTF
jgi:hypothetical protein